VPDRGDGTCRVHQLVAGVRLEVEVPVALAELEPRNAVGITEDDVRSADVARLGGETQQAPLAGAVDAALFDSAAVRTK
jgi:hypothetical protein